MATTQKLLKPIQAFREFIQLESASGIILLSMAIVALAIDNSPWQTYYEKIVYTQFGVHIIGFQLVKPLIFWINDGLMAVFFLLVSLEIKRELLVGELNSLAKACLPGIAALGGMLFPALIYLLFNYHDSVAIRGWAIPTATDIAFSLGILALLGKRVPVALKVFLTALAIFDDLGAIIVIAVFYTANISIIALIFAGLCLFSLFILNRLNVQKIAPYIIVSMLLWLAVLKSGVHPTLAGVVLAFAIPLRGQNPPEKSLLRKMEHKLHPWVAYLILPLFALANAGVSFSGIHLSNLISPVPLGIIFGLFFGKQFGIFLATWIAVKLRIAKIPSRSSWPNIYGIGLVCGVGFTMSLFIGGLAFDELLYHEYAALVRFGVLAGSFISGVIGYLLLHLTTSKD